MSGPQEWAEGRDEPRQYQIRVKEHLDARWGARFGHLSLSYGQGGTTLSGLLSDQAALYGMLKKVRDSGLTLIAVVQLAAEEAQPLEVDPAPNPHRSGS